MIKNRNWSCPYCDAKPVGDHRFKVHLTGTLQRHGHELAEEDAEFVIRKVLLGLKVPTVESFKEAEEEEEETAEESE